MHCLVGIEVEVGIEMIGMIEVEVGIEMIEMIEIVPVVAVIHPEGSQVAAAAAAVLLGARSSMSLSCFLFLGGWSLLLF